MSYDPNIPDLPERLPRSTAAEKVNLPGIFLIVVGILNVLGSLYFAFEGVRGLTTSAADIEQKKKEMSAEERRRLEEAEKAGFSAEKLTQIARGSAGVTLAVGVLGVLAAIVTILAGVKMRSLQSRGLVMTGSILAMIPCISPLGCCLIGQGVGIWSLITASNPDVKAAFRS
jgi:hypothetical protein